MERRKFTKDLIKSVLSYGLISSLISNNAIGKEIKPITRHWALQLQEFCADLKKDAISIEEWRQFIGQLYAHVELSELLQFIDFEQLKRGFQYPDLGVNTKVVKFPRLAGLPPRTAFVKKIFGMKKGRSIIPHGHSNMVSAHLLIEGDLHLRHYDKIRIEDQHMIVKPSIDKLIRMGDYSTISDDKDNVHWFVAESETAFTFDVIMLNLDEKAYDIHNLDIYKKEALSNGQMRVPILDVETALKKYGKEMHH